jgi:hypothetical protein
MLNTEINLHHEECIYLNDDYNDKNNEFHLKLRKSEVTEHEIALVGACLYLRIQVSGRHE